MAAETASQLIVFAGPTITDKELAELGAFDVRGPAKRGDVYLACAGQPRAIAIIDGYFDQTPSVWHKEILWALTLGIKVYGGSSLGALRAAELAAQGMRGVGQIFSQLLRGEIVADDEVAVAHASAEHGYRASSEALVNIRCTLSNASQQSVLSDAGRAALEKLARSTWYPDRNYPDLLRHAGSLGVVASAELDALAAWLPKGRVDLKKQDARLLMEVIRAQWAEPAPTPSFSFELTDAWLRLCSTLDRRSTAIQTSAANDGAWPAAVLRAVAMVDARAKKTQLSAREVNTAVEAFRREKGLLSEEAFDTWANQHFADDAALRRFFSEEALVRALAGRHGRLAQAYLENARLSTLQGDALLVDRPCND
ncbi:MAG TPA: TfuA-like protein [Polyangiaceae bacterium]